MPAGHKLAQRNSIRVDDLSHETLLLLEDGHCLRDQALDICSSADVHEKQDFRATSLETMRQMVAAGVGVTLLPALSVQAPVPPSPDVAVLPIAAPVPHRTIGMLWRPTTVHHELLAMVAAVLRDLPADLTGVHPLAAPAPAPAPASN